MKKEIVFFLFIILGAFNIFSENTVYQFGSDNENLILLTAYRGKNNAENSATMALEKFAKELEDSYFSSRVIIVIADNDILNLPIDIAVKEFRNIKQIINETKQYKRLAHFILADGLQDSVQIIAGANKLTSPSWLFKDIYQVLEKTKIKVDFKSNYFFLYRLGLLPNDEILEYYLNENIPTIKISTNIDINKQLKELINIYSEGIPNEWDKYYTAKFFLGFKIISEKVLIIIVLCIIFLALMYIFIFSFLFGSKKEIHIKDLFKLWRVPFLLFILSLLSFYLGEYFVRFLFYIKFENINMYPNTSSLLKILISFLVSSLFLKLNKFKKFPKNTFIYGYLTLLVCFINIFIFSSFNLSYSILFLEICVLSFFSFRFKKVYWQIIFLILNVLLLFYYFYPIFFMPNNTIKVIFYANNFLLASFFLPYNLMVMRLTLQIQKGRSRIKLNKFIIPIALSILSLICVAIILLKAPSVNQKNDFEIFKVTKNKVILPDLSNLKFKTSDTLTPDNFFAVSYTIDSYLDKNICNMKIKPIESASVVKVVITKEDGFPIYESDVKFEMSDDGKTAIFLSPINIDDLFSIKFSTTTKGTLKVKVIAWFENPSLSITSKTNVNKNSKLLFEVLNEFYVSLN